MPGTQPSIWFQEQWSNKVTHLYQSKGYILKGMTTGPTKVIGKKMHFPMQGPGEAQPYKRGDAVKVMNPTKSEVLIDAEEYDAASYVYEYDLERMGVNQVDVERETASMAIARMHDKIIFDKIKASGATSIVGDYASAWDLAKALMIPDLLSANKVDIADGEVYVPLPPRAWSQMLTYDQFSNSQWTGGDLPLVSGANKKSWNGVNWFRAPIDWFTIAGTNLSFYAWHKSAAGSGHTGEQIKSDFAWMAEHKRWFINNTISGGAAILQLPGIIECRMKSDSPITVN